MSISPPRSVTPHNLDNIESSHQSRAMSRKGADSNYDKLLSELNNLIVQAQNFHFLSQGARDDLKSAIQKKEAEIDSLIEANPNAKLVAPQSFVMPWEQSAPIEVQQPASKGCCNLL